MLWSALQARHSFFRPYSVLGFLVDFLLNSGAFLLATTLYSSQPILLDILLLAPVLFAFVLPPSNARRTKKAKASPTASSRHASLPPDSLAPKPFLTFYRGAMLVATSVSILAVDFRLFPRRFAKVETWGTSLMDMGVGAFVFSGGVVAARPVLKQRGSGAQTPLFRRLLLSTRHSVPLLALGVIRLLTVKGLEYAEHVTEYGVHWNFFFTLALLPPFMAAFQDALHVIPSYSAWAVLVGVAYQTLLETTDLKAYILTAPRTDIISKNREGLFSFFGYLSIFLAGQDLGMLIMPRVVQSRSIAGVGLLRNRLIMTMAAWGGTWAALYYVSTSYRFGLGLTVSRRLANLPYVLWVASFNSLQLLAFCLVDTLFFPAFYNAHDLITQKEAYKTATSSVMRAYNRNGLALFLLANLLTGLVNLTVPTLDVTPIVTMAILIAYTATLTGVAVFLDLYDISLKI